MRAAAFLAETPVMTTLNENSTAAPLASEQAQRTVSAWIRPLEVISAGLMLAIFGMLLAGVISRYVLSKPIIWIDEAVSISFLWLAMLGSALAMHRNEHLRLTLFVERMPERLRSYVQALSLVAVDKAYAEGTAQFRAIAKSINLQPQ